jgi:hypothetical protein
MNDNCQIKYENIDYPGFDNEINYGSIDNIGEDISTTFSNMPYSSIDTISTNISNNIPNNLNSNITENFTEIINDPIKKSISTKINNMEFNQTTLNIKNRYERLSGKNLNDNLTNISQDILSETKNDTNSEINLIKNQEETSSTLELSEHNLTEENKKNIQEEQQSNSIKPIKSFWNRYKFWIIIIIIISFLMILGIYIYTNTTSTINNVKPGIMPSKTNINVKSIFKKIGTETQTSDLPSLSGTITSPQIKPKQLPSITTKPLTLQQINVKPSPQSLKVTPPPSLKVTPPPSLKVTPPPSLKVTPPPSLKVTPPPSLKVTPPPSLKVTPPPSLNVTSAQTLNVTPKPTINVSK